MDRATAAGAEWTGGLWVSAAFFVRWRVPAGWTGTCGAVSLAACLGDSCSRDLRETVTGLSEKRVTRQWGS